MAGASIKAKQMAWKPKSSWRVTDRAFQVSVETHDAVDAVATMTLIVQVEICLLLVIRQHVDEAIDSAMCRAADFARGVYE
jgi:hypothetical protein